MSLVQNRTASLEWLEPTMVQEPDPQESCSTNEDTENIEEVITFIFEESLGNEEELEEHGVDVCVKNYTTTSVQEEPLDVTILFRDSPLASERLHFHQEIFNKARELSKNLKLNRLQHEYMSYLQGAVQIEIFNCALPGCEYQTIHKENLKSHLLVVHKMDLHYKLLQCNMCSFSTKKKNVLKKHMQTIHLEQNSVDSFTSSDCENIAEKKKCKEKEQKCSLCTFQTTDKKLFKNHQGIHKCPLKPNTYRCYICAYKTKRKTYLIKHLFKVHQIRTPGIKRLTQKNCHLCTFTTDSQQSMHRHNKIHNLPYLQCTKCEFRSKYKYNLYYHMANHEPQRRMNKHLCEVCSKRFNSRSRLITHSLIHKSIDDVEEVFQCSHCSYRTKIKALLSSHLNIHKTTYKYECAICGYKMRRRYNYENHLLTHKSCDEIKNYQCDLCAFETLVEERFQRHLSKGDHSKTAKKEAPQTMLKCTECSKETKLKDGLSNSSSQWMFCIRCCKITRTEIFQK